MANITKFLPPFAHKRMEMQSVISDVNIDFAKYNAANGDTVEALIIPGGTYVEDVILSVHTPEASVTVEVGDEATADQFLAAQTLTDIKANASADDGAVASVQAARKFYAKDTKIILTIGGADAKVANISLVLRGTLVAKTAYTNEQYV